MKSDPEMCADVIAELNFDPAIESSLISVDVDHGFVTLSGSIPTYWQKMHAEDDARSVSGVRGLADYLDVVVPAPLFRSDADIQTAAMSALRWHSDLPNSIYVSVADGWITLTGKVDWQFQRDEAEDAVEYMAGVKGVFNQITLRQQPKAVNVKDQITSELVRRVDQDAQNITVETTDGKVTLTGNVRTFAEEQAAVDASWSVPGVVQVDDQLVVGSV